MPAEEEGRQCWIFIGLAPSLRLMACADGEGEAEVDLARRERKQRGARLRDVPEKRGIIIERGERHYR